MSHIERNWLLGIFTPFTRETIPKLHPVQSPSLGNVQSSPQIDPHAHEIEALADWRNIMDGFPHINLVNYYIRALEPVQMKRKSSNNPILLHISFLLKQPELACQAPSLSLNILLFTSILDPTAPRGGIWLLPAGILYLIHKEYVEHCIGKVIEFIKYFVKIGISNYPGINFFHGTLRNRKWEQVNISSHFSKATLGICFLDNVNLTRACVHQVVLDLKIDPHIVWILYKQGLILAV